MRIVQIDSREEEIRSVGTPFRDLAALADLLVRAAVHLDWFASVTVDHVKQPWIGTDRKPIPVRRPGRVPGAGDRREGSRRRGAIGRGDPTASRAAICRYRERNEPTVRRPG